MQHDCGGGSLSCCKPVGNRSFTVCTFGRGPNQIMKSHSEREIPKENSRLVGFVMLECSTMILFDGSNIISTLPADGP
jgi:hypothetical protein